MSKTDAREIEPQDPRPRDFRLRPGDILGMLIFGLGIFVAAFTTVAVVCLAVLLFLVSFL